MLILCDRFGGFSIGDGLIGGALSLEIGLWLWKSRTSPVLLREKQGHDAKSEKGDSQWQ